LIGSALERNVSHEIEEYKGKIWGEKTNSVLSEWALVVHKLRDGKFRFASFASPAIGDGEYRFIKKMPILPKEGFLGFPIARLEDVLSVHLRPSVRLANFKAAVHRIAIMRLTSTLSMRSLKSSDMTNCPWQLMRRSRKPAQTTPSITDSAHVITHKTPNPSTFSSERMDTAYHEAQSFEMLSAGDWEVGDNLSFHVGSSGDS
jgi:hypothetical protein